MSDQNKNRPARNSWGIRLWLLIAFIVCLLIGLNLDRLIYFGSNIFVRYIPHHLSKEALLPLTSELPSVDRIEIESVQADFETVSKVLATKILFGNEAKEFGNIWRAQNYIYGIETACHEPGYRVRFYKNGALLTEATVCFHCQNIYFYRYPGAKGYKDEAEVVFGNLNPKITDRALTKLRIYLSDLFPGHDPDAEKL